MNSACFCVVGSRVFVTLELDCVLHSCNVVFQIRGCVRNMFFDVILKHAVPSENCAHWLVLFALGRRGQDIGGTGWGFLELCFIGCQLMFIAMITLYSDVRLSSGCWPKTSGCHA